MPAPVTQLIECFIPCLAVDFGECEARVLEFACVPLNFRVLNGLDDQSSIGVGHILEGMVNAVDMIARSRRSGFAQRGTRRTDYVLRNMRA
jgi:hypothetical protein